MIYLITYDTEERSDAGVVLTLTRSGAVEALSCAWLLDDEQRTAKQIADELLQTLGGQDRLLVVEVHGGAWSNLLHSRRCEKFFA